MNICAIAGSLKACSMPKLADPAFCHSVAMLDMVHFIKSSVWSQKGVFTLYTLSQCEHLFCSVQNICESISYMYMRGFTFDSNL